MMQFIGFLLSLVVAVALAVFSMFNNEIVVMTYSPVHDPMSLPLYFIALGFLAFGFIWGGFNVWINGGRGRQERRDLKRLVKKLEDDIKNFEKGGQPGSMSNDLFPVIDKK